MIGVNLASLDVLDPSFTLCFNPTTHIKYKYGIKPSFSDKESILPSLFFTNKLPHPIRPLCSPPKMCCITCRIVFLVFSCIAFLSVQPETVSASRNIDQIMKVVALEATELPLNVAPSPAMMFDPNQSEKRTVRGGSDPIHNRS